MENLQEKIDNLDFFLLLPEHTKETIRNKEKAMELIQHVAITHKQNSNMTDYRFFEEKMEKSFWATRYWEHEYETLSDENKEAFDYVLKLRDKS